MKRACGIVIAAAWITCIAGCSHKESTSDTSTTTTQSEPAATSTATPLDSSAESPSVAASPSAASNSGGDYSSSAKTPVTFEFPSIQVSTDNPPILRLALNIRNGSKDPVQCDASEFSVMPSDGTVIDADSSADNSCEPDIIDPHSSGKATMVFDLKSSYSGPLSVIMTVEGKVVGRGSITIH
ncbi:MAG: hypothetical protein GIW99_02780 [Candidatus Eremiobacteraeota bacterium]|nr:hypothetical protein [Candidatus Eremiobacteraeota bacterium]MBC5826599.1 hypothetical protein [Candidatus Eremiobacteraeota bacterium]